MKPSRELIVVAAAAVAVTAVDVAAVVVVVVVTVVAVTAITIVTNANRVGNNQPRTYTDRHGLSQLTVLNPSVLLRESPWLFSCLRFERQAQLLSPTHDLNHIFFTSLHLAKRSRVVVNVFDLTRSDLHDLVSGF